MDLLFQLGHFTFCFEDGEICLFHCDPLGLSASWAAKKPSFLSGKKSFSFSLASLSFSPCLFHNLHFTAPLFQENAAVAFPFFFCFLPFPFEPLVCWKIFWRSKVVLTLLPESKPGLSFSSCPLRQHCFLVAFLTILNHFLHTVKNNICVLTAASSDAIFLPLLFSRGSVILYFSNCPFWTLSLSSYSFLPSAFPFIPVLLDHEAVFLISSYLRCLLFILCLKEQLGILLMRGHDCKACQHNMLKSGLLLCLWVSKIFWNLAELY